MLKTTTKTKNKDVDKEAKNESERKEDLKKGLLFLLIPISAIITALIITGFFINLAYVPSDSMTPTVPGGSVVIGSRLAYSDSLPKRGDVVFARHTEAGDALLIKRVVAIPGDRVSIEDGTLFVNGLAVREDYVKKEKSESMRELTVPNGACLLMGDNRAESVDSRYWNDPFVPIENIKGKALFVIFPKLKSLNG